MQLASSSSSAKSLKDSNFSFSNLISCFRSRDRFLESSQQIEALVERFSRETNISDGPPNAGVVGKIPLAYGKPGELKVWAILYVRLLASTFSCGLTGLKTLSLRVFAIPVALSILWLLYSQVGVRSIVIKSNATHYERISFLGRSTRIL